VFSPKCASKSWRRHLLVLRNSRRASTDSCEFFDCTSMHHSIVDSHKSELVHPLGSYKPILSPLEMSASRPDLTLRSAGGSVV
jgi:hypothetical protein